MAMDPYISALNQHISDLDHVIVVIHLKHLQLTRNQRQGVRHAIAARTCLLNMRNSLQENNRLNLNTYMERALQCLDSMRLELMVRQWGEKFHEHAMNGEEQALRDFCKNDDEKERRLLAEKDNHGRNALMVAAMYRKVEVMQYLVDTMQNHGLTQEIAAKDNEGRNAFWLVVIGDDPESMPDIVDFMLHDGNFDPFAVLAPPHPIRTVFRLLAEKVRLAKDEATKKILIGVMDKLHANDKEQISKRNNEFISIFEGVLSSQQQVCPDTAVIKWFCTNSPLRDDGKPLCCQERTPRGESALQVAVRCTWLEAVKMLLVYMSADDKKPSASQEASQEAGRRNVFELACAFDIPTDWRVRDTNLAAMVDIVECLAQDQDIVNQLREATPELRRRVLHHTIENQGHAPVKVLECTVNALSGGLLEHFAQEQEDIASLKDALLALNWRFERTIISTDNEAKSRLDACHTRFTIALGLRRRSVLGDADFYKPLLKFPDTSPSCDSPGSYDDWHNAIFRHVCIVQYLVANPIVPMVPIVQDPEFRQILLNLTVAIAKMENSFTDEVTQYAMRWCLQQLGDAFEQTVQVDSQFLQLLLAELDTNNIQSGSVTENAVEEAAARIRQAWWRGAPVPGDTQAAEQSEQDDPNKRPRHYAFRRVGQLSQRVRQPCSSSNGTAKSDATLRTGCHGTGWCKGILQWMHAHGACHNHLLRTTVQGEHYGALLFGSGGGDGYVAVYSCNDGRSHCYEWFNDTLRPARSTTSEGLFGDGTRQVTWTDAMHVLGVPQTCAGTTNHLLERIQRVMGCRTAMHWVKNNIHTVDLVDLADWRTQFPHVHSHEALRLMRTGVLLTALDHILEELGEDFLHEALQQALLKREQHPASSHRCTLATIGPQACPCCHKETRRRALRQLCARCILDN